MKKTLLFILLSFFAFCSTTGAATFYIDHDAGNDANNSTQAQGQSTPWAHMPGMSGCASACASYSVQSGDVFILKGGVTWTPVNTTADIITLPATSITIRGGQLLSTPWGTGYPVLDGATSTSNRTGIVGAGNSVVIDGLKLINIGNPSDNDGGWGIFLDGPAGAIEIKNCWLETSAIDAIAVTMTGGNISQTLIHDNHFKGNGRVEIGQGDLSSAYSMDDVQIYNNIYEGPGRAVTYGIYHTDGFMIQASNKAAYGVTNLKIHHNIFRGDWYSGGTALIYLSGCSPFTANSQCVGEGDPAACCTGEETGTCVDFANAVCTASTTPYACCTGVGTGTCMVSCKTSGNGPYSTQHTEIHNNVFSHENNSWKSGTGPDISPALVGAFIGGHEDLKIYNNTFSSDATAVPVGTCLLVDAVKDVIVKNNLLSGCANGLSFGTYIQGTLTVDYNLYNVVTRYINGWPSSAGSDCRNLTDCRAAPFNSEANGKAGSPLFIAIPNGTSGSGNWGIQSESPAKTGGANLGSPYTTDLNGVVGTGRFGAYEYYETGSIRGVTASGVTIH